MKRILYILVFIFFTGTPSQSQDDGGGKVRERMTQYIQDRLNLSKPEAERFGPVFLNYFNDLRKTNQEYKGDRLVLQQKIAELRVNYRNQFKNIVGDKKSNDVFTYERDFIEGVRQLQQERRQNDKGQRNKKSGLLQ